MNPRPSRWWGWIHIAEILAKERGAGPRNWCRCEPNLLKAFHHAFKCEAPPLFLAFKLDGGKLVDITTTTTMICCACSEVLSFGPHQSFSKNAMQAIVFIYSLALLLACMARAMNLGSMGSLEQGKSSQQRNLCPSAGLALLQGLPQPFCRACHSLWALLQGPRAMIPSPNPLPFCRAGPVLHSLYEPPSLLPFCKEGLEQECKKGIPNLKRNCLQAAFGLCGGSEREGKTTQPHAGILA